MVSAYRPPSADSTSGWVLPEVPACGAAFAVCGVLDRCMELEAMYRKGWQDAEKLVQWYRAAKAEA